MKRLTGLLLVLLLLLTPSCRPIPYRTPMPASPTAPPLPTKSSSPTVKATITACVNASSLRVRSGPGTEYAIVSGLEEGECVELDGRNEDGEWVRYAGGWMAAGFLDYVGSITELPVVYSSTPTAENGGS